MPTTLPSPVVVSALVGSSASVQVMPVNLTRQGLYVFNASAVVIWVCPATTGAGAPVAAAVNGAGSVAIPSQQGLTLAPRTTPQFTNALNAIAASGSNNPLSIWEFYQ